MRAITKDEFKRWQRLPLLELESRKPPQGFGVRRVRSEGTRRFAEDGNIQHSTFNIQRSTSESGDSPVPRQPPQSKALTREKLSDDLRIQGHD